MSIRQHHAAWLLATAMSITACGKGGEPPQVGAAASAGVGDEPFRKSAPPPGPAPVLKAPVPQLKELANGLQIWAVEKRGLPLVHVEIVTRVGSAADPATLPGLAGFLAAVMKSGTTTRSAEQIADEVETLGSSLYFAVEEESMTLGFSAMRENLEALFAVAADVLLHPALAPDEIERVRRERLAELARERDDPRSNAARLFQESLFPAHPYGHTVLGNEAAIKAIDLAALRAFYQQHLRPNISAAVVVGDLGVEEMTAAVTRLLAAWEGQAVVPPPPGAPAASAPALLLVDRPNAPQSQLSVGHIGVSRDHPDYFNLVMLNAILGGLFHSRINMNLREDKKYTYGARSYFDFRHGPGSFVVATAVRTDATAPAIQEILKEIQTIRSEPVSDEELQAAKNRYTLSLSGYFQTVAGIGNMMANIYLYDLPKDYYQRLPERLAAVTVADVQRVANEQLHPDALSIVVVGDQEAVAAELNALGRGTVRLVDPAAR